MSRNVGCRFRGMYPAEVSLAISLRSVSYTIRLEQLFLNIDNDVMSRIHIRCLNTTAAHISTIMLTTHKAHSSKIPRRKSPWHQHLYRGPHNNLHRSCPSQHTTPFPTHHPWHARSLRYTNLHPDNLRLVHPIRNRLPLRSLFLWPWSWSNCKRFHLFLSSIIYVPCPSVANYFLLCLGGRSGCQCVCSSSPFDPRRSNLPHSHRKRIHPPPPESRPRRCRHQNSASTFYIRSFPRFANMASLSYYSVNDAFFWRCDLL